MASADRSAAGGAAAARATATPARPLAALARAGEAEAALQLGDAGRTRLEQIYVRDRDLFASADAPQETLPQIEQLVCARARTFFGWEASSWSDYVERMRLWMHDIPPPLPPPKSVHALEHRTPSPWTSKEAFDAFQTRWLDAQGRWDPTQVAGVPDAVRGGGGLSTCKGLQMDVPDGAQRWLHINRGLVYKV